MTVLIEDEQEYQLPFDPQAVAETVVEAVLDEERCPYEAQVDLVLTTDEEIHRVNREFRGIDRPTDVLSFPAVDYEAPADYGILEEQEDCFDPDTGELLLGDMMISIPRLRAQALEYGHSEKREYAFLIAHSMLHLLGYDHMEEEEAAVMEEKQEAVLQILKITRQGGTE